MLTKLKNFYIQWSISLKQERNPDSDAVDFLTRRINIAERADYYE